jgi:3D (Asp-Asp-Asp) domain-containing protein
MSARQAEQRRLLLRGGATVLSIAAAAVVAVAVPRFFPASRSPLTRTAVVPPPGSSPTPTVKSLEQDKIRWKTVVATAYCPHCRVCETTGVTYTGREAIPDGVAVARIGPRAARLGTKLLVPGRGWLLVDDVGGGVDSNQIDIRVSTHEEAVHFGRRQLRVGVMKSPRG